jgi:hypothetical protein
MRQDLEILLRPIERAKHDRRRAIVRSRFGVASLAVVLLTAALILLDGDRPLVALLFVACGLGAIAFQFHRLARIADPVPPEWLFLAVEARLSRQGRAELTPMLLQRHVSCDEALAWGRAERDRPLDDEPAAGRRRHLVGH